MMHKPRYTQIFWAIATTILAAAHAQAQQIPQSTAPQNGVYNDRTTYYAFVNATLVKDYQTTIPNATLLIKNDKVEQTGTIVAIPDGATVIDLKGKYIYPSFIDIYSDYGAPVRPKNNAQNPPATKPSASYWNDAIHPEVAAYTTFVPNAERAKTLREAGFGVVMTHLPNGIARGTSTAVLLGSNDQNENLLLKPIVAQHFALRKGTSEQPYPNSLMGAIALLRQTYYDAQWYAKNPNADHNTALNALNINQKLPQIIETNDKIDILRADKIGDEFGIQYIFKTNGTEYQRIDDIKNTGGTLIVPLNFADAYDVEDLYNAANITLTQLKHWEMAPTNPATIAQNKINFALTTHGTDVSKFWAMMRKAIQYGLTEEQALKALTHTPAKIMALDNAIGSLDKGKKANFFITSKDIFQDDAVLYQHWISGEMYTHNALPPTTDLRGTYDLQLNTATAATPITLQINGETPESIQITLQIDTNTIDVKHKITGDFITLTFVENKKTNPNATRLTGIAIAGKLSGTATLPDATTTQWQATRTPKPISKKNKDSNPPEETKKPKIGTVWYPFGAYGSANVTIKNEAVLFKNATVWTSETEGILQNTDVLISNGRIDAIGKNLRAANAKVIDATGKHLTAGIIDEHSHIAISGGVNEASQEVTAEVRIGDVIDSEDIDIYRQLAGGVTTSHLLHGSANPIGGQTALIKLRWGQAPEAMKIQGADGFIKFALGENPKQSNWGDNNTTRYPQTRMGVEQVIYDAFHRAKIYADEQKNCKNNCPRKNLELDALQEILDNKRFITCHSYVQSEINMLLHAADSMHFKVNTFTHILEGYKLADKLQAHGANASTFADWWAYKYEVIDAIPHNAALLQQQGVNVCINSDDAEMGRRLNQEAAKTIKYGGSTPTQALNMITINPAKTLHIADKVGSIKVGKDADIVLWTADPLSIYARVQQTYIDGVCLYDADNDAKIIQQNALEKERIIQKMIEIKQKGGKTQPATAPKKQHYHCDTVIDSY